ncbi:hypothetical protein ERC79_14325 [Rhodococcus sp. ABRD24]|uniref:HAD hydrolase family protein n=1 Tax=Rhodococcus sp. ABRD24 TaxID=2507582 RepID=UPI00103ADF18|nr:HAD hydrolase family protein [Rhodococcus sp. ABRD24]QBJ96996.1 hypothetical protein ERC79_14325 [Rhodococcus sp. ABRD24]
MDSTPLRGNAVLPDPRLVVTDLDGTLLTSHKTVSAATVAALRAARDAGLHLAVASARPLRLIESVLSPVVLDLLSAVIVSNGAAIVDPRSKGGPLHEVAVSADAGGDLIRVLRRRWPDAGFGWEFGTHFACDPEFLTLTRTETILRDPHPDLVAAGPAAPVHQLVMAVPGRVPRDLVDVVAAALGESFAVTDSLGGVVEISLARADKGAAAHWLAQSLEFSMDQVIAFGDEHNDLPLLTRAGVGVAMGNASAPVRAAATAVTTSNDEDGVASFLTRAVLSGARPVRT